MMADIAVILLHFPAVRQLVYCTALRYHFNLEERNTEDCLMFSLGVHCVLGANKNETTVPLQLQQRNLHHQNPHHTHIALYASLLA